MNRQIIELSKEFLKENYSFLYKEEYKAYEFEVYLDYRDTMSSEDLIGYLKKGYSRMDIIGELHDNFIDSFQYEEDYVLKEILSYINSINSDLVEDMDIFELREIVILENELITVTVDYDRIINGAKIPVNVMLESEQSFDYEFGHNEFSYDIEEFFENVKEEIESGMDKEDFSIITLIESQGYTVDQFLEYINKETSKEDENKFFNSLYNEYLNTTSGCNSLIVHKYLSLEEYEELKKQETIEIGTSEIVGYVSHVYGAGSMLDITLEKPLQVKQEDCKVIVDGGFGYGVTSIYGYLDVA